MKYFLYFLPFFLLQSCHGQSIKKIAPSPDENSLLWEITGNSLPAPSYLFGTFHLMCKDEIIISSNLNQAILNSSEVYLEIDLDDPANMLGALLLLNMRNGETLKNLYTAEEYFRLEHFFNDSLKMNISMFGKMKPDFLESLLYPKMMKCKAVSGVEEKIMELAKKSKKEIRGLETIAFQAAIFDSIPYKEQAKELLDMIDSIGINAENFNSMLLVYKTQQLAKLEQMFNDPRFRMDDSQQDVMLDRRNKNWVEQLQKIMPVTNVFVAVGAGHLVGEKGLISLLKKSGYTVTPLLNK